jgi:hypothetical protein
VHLKDRELCDAIYSYIGEDIDDPRPFIWTKSVARFCARTLDRSGTLASTDSEHYDSAVDKPSMIGRTTTYQNATEATAKSASCTAQIAHQRGTLSRSSGTCISDSHT